jgi:hypothetical protein
VNARDPLRWLTSLAEVIRPGGVVSLALPDMRFTFDVNRRLSEFSDVLDAYLRCAVVPSCAQLYDYHTLAIPADARLLWDGLADYRRQRRPGDLRREAFNAAVALSQGGPYIDVHCYTFTPRSFVELFASFGEFGLVEFKIAELVPTRRHAWEFFVHLERLDPDLSDDERHAQFRAGIEHADQLISRASGPGGITG